MQRRPFYQTAISLLVVVHIATTTALSSSTTSPLAIVLFRSHERTAEELELVFEELVHISALSHLSTSIKRELASIIVFEAHAAAGTVCKYPSIYSIYYVHNYPTMDTLIVYFR